MSTNANDVAVEALRMLAYVAALEYWHRMPWYQRLVTPKPKMPA